MTRRREDDGHGLRLQRVEAVEPVEVLPQRVGNQSRRGCPGFVALGDRGCVLEQRQEPELDGLHHRGIGVHESGVLVARDLGRGEVHRVRDRDVVGDDLLLVDVPDCGDRHTRVAQRADDSVVGCLGSAQHANLDAVSMCSENAVEKLPRERRDIPPRHLHPEPRTGAGYGVGKRDEEVSTVTVIRQPSRLDRRTHRRSPIPEKAYPRGRSLITDRQECAQAEMVVVAGRLLERGQSFACEAMPRPSRSASRDTQRTATCAERSSAAWTPCGHDPRRFRPAPLIRTERHETRSQSALR